MDKKEVTPTDNSFGVAGVVFGILSLVLAVTMVLGILFGLLGLIFSIVQWRRQRTGWAVTGVILSVLGLIFSVVILIMVISFVTHLAGCFQNPDGAGCESIKDLVTQQQAFSQQQQAFAAQQQAYSSSSAYATTK